MNLIKFLSELIKILLLTLVGSILLKLIIDILIIQPISKIRQKKIFEKEILPKINQQYKNLIEQQIDNNKESKDE